MQSTIQRPQNMRSFMVIWLGELISMVGSGLTSFALGVWIYQKTGQATPFALTVLFGSLPAILLAPIAGSISDRWNRKKVMILADTGSALVTLAVVLLLAADRLEVGGIYLVAFLGSIFAAFQEPAYLSSVTMLVPPKDLGRASGMAQAGQALQELVCPALAGVLFVTIGLQGVILIDFVSYFFAVTALLVTKIPQPVVTESTGTAAKGLVWQDTIFSWQYLRARSGLLGILLYFALVNFLLNVASVLISPLVLSFAPASTLGMVQTVSGIGMLLGSLILSAWGGPRPRIFGTIGFIIFASLGLLLMGLRANPYLIAVGFFLLMGNIPLSRGSSQAIFQTKIAAGMQGRVFAMRSMISRSMMPLAFLIAGPLADKIFEPAFQAGGLLANSLWGQLLGVGAGRGIGMIFFLSGIILIIISVLAALIPAIRNVERDLPDELPEAVIVESQVGLEDTAAI